MQTHKVVFQDKDQTSNCPNDSIKRLLAKRITFYILITPNSVKAIP